MVMYHQPKFGYKQLNGYENIIQTIIGWRKGVGSR